MNSTELQDVINKFNAKNQSSLHLDQSCAQGRVSQENDDAGYTLLGHPHDETKKLIMVIKQAIYNSEDFRGQIDRELTDFLRQKDPERTRIRNV